jgi:hypothetical protein
MQYLEIATQATFTLKTGAGYLQGICVNLPNGGSIRIFDNIAASGTAIAGGAAAFALPAAGSFLNYDCHFSNGLTIVTSVANPSITVTFY